MRQARDAFEVFLIFLKLGLSSFGGPIAHLGYFREEFVVRRGWLDEASYADLVALCQFLPGPASSQTGFSIGLMRAGALGGLAAWVGFTLPSALLMLAFSLGAGSLGGPFGAGLLHGLRLVAVAIVAQAVWGMARTLCPDRPRAGIALAATLILLSAPSSLAQIAAILLGAIAGFLLCRDGAAVEPGSLPMPVSRCAAVVALALFCVLLIALPLLRGFPAVTLFDAFYRSGALVFGGGHVVLPLLREAFVTPGWVSEDAFLAGYGAAQAVPGPLFTFAVYLGALASPLHPIGGALLGLFAIFSPGVLVLIGALPFWQSFRDRAGARAVMRGINASVVGILGAALYAPLWTSSVKAPGDFALVLAGFVLLIVWRMKPVLMVILGALGGVGLAAFG
jgi:chromate transporter